MNTALSNPIRAAVVVVLSAVALWGCRDTLYEVVPVATVTIAGVPAQLEAGQTAQLSAQVKGSAGRVLAGRTISWSTSDPAVATVSLEGVLAAHRAGAVTIEASCEMVTGTASTTVTPRPVASVEVAPASATLTVGDQLPLAATVRAGDGTVLTDRPVTWSSSASSVAEVSTGGVVTAVAAGSATITATAEGRSGSAQVTVERTVGSIEVSPTDHRMNVGWGWSFFATVRDTDGVVWDDRAVTWSTSSQAVATVDQTGRVTAVGAGTAEVRATADDVVGSSPVTISADQCAAITVWPPQANLTDSLSTASCSFWAGAGPSEFFGWLLSSQSSVVGTLNATGFRPALAFHGSDATYASVRYYAHRTAAVGETSVTNRALLAPGHYLLEANSNDGGTGPYAMEITWGGSNPEITNCTPWYLGPPIDYQGSLAATDCERADGSYEDFFLLRLTSQERVTITLSSSEFDSVLWLFDSNWNLVAFDDDSGGGLDARLVYTAPASGLYFVLANSFGPEETGAYRLQIETTGGSSGPPAPVAGVLPPEAIEAEMPASIFRLRLPKGVKK